MRSSPLIANLRGAPARETVGAVLLVAMLLQAAIPMGFMPGAAGSRILQLCTGWALDTGTPTREQGDHHSVAMCPFAAAILLGGVGPSLANVTSGIAAVFHPTLKGRSPAATRTGPPRTHNPRAPPVAQS